MYVARTSLSSLTVHLAATTHCPLTSTHHWQAEDIVTMCLGLVATVAGGALNVT